MNQKMEDKIEQYYRTLWKRYWPETTYQTPAGRIECHVAADIEGIALSSENPEETLERFRKEILALEDGGKILYALNWTNIEKSFAIRRDFASALRNVKEGRKLAPDLGWSFYDRDIVELAKLHKAGKFRKKIEDLLEDCNFHYECGLLAAKEYDELLSMEKAS